MFSYSDAQEVRTKRKIYAIPRDEYKISTVFEEAIDFIEPNKIVRSNSLKFNNHETPIYEGKLARILVPVCPVGYYPVSYFMKGNLESYKKNIIHCLKDEFIEFAPIDNLPLNGTSTCLGLETEFIFPLVRDGLNEKNVTYNIGLCNYYYMSQFIF